MPNRIIRDGILTSERVDRIADNPAVEVFYRRLHSVADDFGRFTAHPSLLRAALYPLRLDKITDGEVSAHMAACASAGLIRLYRVDGKTYLEVQDFKQRTRAQFSKYPPPEGHARDSGASGVCQVDTGRTARDAQMTVIGPSCDCPMRTETEAETETYFGDAYSETEACANGAMPLDAFFEERYARHPKKRDRILAQHALAGIPGIESSQKQEEFRSGHEAWIATDDYTWQGGAKCPTLAEFVSDKTWTYPPTEKPTGRASTIEEAKRIYREQQKAS